MVTRGIERRVSSRCGRRRGIWRLSPVSAASGERCKPSAYYGVAGRDSPWRPDTCITTPQPESSHAVCQRNRLVTAADPVFR